MIRPGRHLAMAALALVPACAAPMPEAVPDEALMPALATPAPAPSLPLVCWNRPATDTGAALPEGPRFQVPCPETLTEAFIASLQRALAARGVYAGPVTGRLDAPTRAAIAAWQAPLGIASEDLSMQAARQLGLVAWS